MRRIPLNNQYKNNKEKPSYYHIDKFKQTNEQLVKFIILKNISLHYVKLNVMTKSYNKYNHKVLTFFLVTLISFGCRKKGCTDPMALNYDEKANYSDGNCEYDSSSKFDLSIKAYHLFNSNPFYIDSSYLDDFGNKIKFSRASFYLGNPSFKNINGTIDTLTYDYVLINPHDSIYSLSSLNEINFHSVNLRIGVDSITNHTDPGNKPNNNSLSYQTPSMHWQMGIDSSNWSYLFIVIEGQVDIDGNNNFDPGENFVFHIGGDGFSKLINDIPFNLSNDSTFFSINVNWESIINNIDLSIDNFTHTMDNIPLATEISNNSIDLITEHF